MVQHGIPDARPRSRRPAVPRGRRRHRRPARPRPRAVPRRSPDLLARDARPRAAAEARRSRQPRLRAVHGGVRHRGHAHAAHRPRVRVERVRVRGLRLLPARPWRARACLHPEAGGEADPAAAARRRRHLPLPAIRRQRRPRRPRARRLRRAARLGSRAPPAAAAARPHAPESEPARRPARRHARRLRQRRARRRTRCRSPGARIGNKNDMKPFVIDRHGRLMFPSNFLPELDFSVMPSLETLDAVIARDFEKKAPTGTDILERIEDSGYESRYELMRAVALNLVWVNRYAMTMYEKRPTRWRDVPRKRDDVFLPILTPWEDGERKVAAVARAYEALPSGPDPEAEDRIFGTLFDVFAHRPHHATELPAIKPTVAEILADASNLTFSLDEYDPDYPVHGFEAIRDCRERVPELESLHRLAMVLHDQYPWDRERARLKAVGELEDDDFVVLFAPRNPDVLDFIRRAKSGERPPTRPSPLDESRAPVAPYPAVQVR